MEDLETHSVVKKIEDIEHLAVNGTIAIYIGKNSRKEHVKTILQRCRPSTNIHKTWLMNRSLLRTEDIDFKAMDSEWADTTANGDEIPINQWTIRDMAEKYNYKSGYWFFFPESDDEVDCAWDLISKGMMNEEDLGAIAMAACVEPCDKLPKQREKYIICVYNIDYTDESQVFAIEKFLRKAGINEPLMYKLDIYTHLVIYKENYYGLRPSLYRSTTISYETMNVYLSQMRMHTKPKIIKYITGCNNNGLSVDDWRKQYSPSQLNRKSGICQIRTNDYDDIVYDNLMPMLRLWRQHILLELPLTHKKIDNLSCENNIKRGRWYFYTDSGYKVDILWKLLVNGFANGKLNNVAISAEVMPSYSDQHVIKVCNRDYTNTEEVYQMEKLIREIGVKCKMIYEPVIYCHLGIYRKNFQEHGLDSTIYTSYYDAFKHESKIHVLRELHADASENV